MASKKGQKQKGLTSRYIFIACLFVAWMGVLIWRLSYLQITRHEELLEKAQAQQGEAESIKSFRGEIVDRQGRLLAGSLDADSVMADLHQMQERTKMAIVKTLAPLIRTTEDDLNHKLSSGNQAPILAKKVDAETSKNIRAVLETNKFKGIKIIRETQRFYPNGALASHIIGFVNAAEDGVTGLERQLNKFMSGQDGKILFEKDALGNAFSRIDREALAGARIMTTIDAALQYQVEEALTTALNETQAESVSAIVLDPQTGEILAMANAPSFAPTAKFGGTDSEAYIRRNRAITDVYEPGSVFKLVTYSAAIEEGLAHPEEKINCGNGQITLGSRVIHDTHPYSELTVAEALAKSSNVAAIKIAMRVGKEKFADYMYRFGFGRKTGIDLPAEAFGLVSPLRKWGSTSLASMAIGHEVGVTALQAVSAMASIANRGVWVQPHVVKKIVTGDSGQRTLWEPTIDTRQVVKEQTATTIKGMLEDVVEIGTARHGIQLAGYTAAGKTGTAQKVVHGTYSNSAYMASFAGFVPASTPRFAIIVLLDNPKGAHQGGQVAAPIFNQIAQAALSSYGVLPDTAEHRQAIAALEEKFRATPKNWNTQPEATPPPAQTATVPSQQKTVLPAPSPNVQQAKRVPAPKSTPVLKLPTDSTQRTETATKVRENEPQVLGYHLREVASLCSQAKLRLRAIGSGVAKSQRRVGETLIVEFR